MEASTKIVVVGVGALGSHLVQLLRNLGTIRVIDDDRVEMKNTLSQFHPRTGVRKNKTKSLEGLMKLLWGLKIEANPFRLTEGNVEALLRDADIVVDCLDNTESRQIIQAYVRRHNIPCLHGALSAAEHSMGVVQWDESFTIDDDAGAGAATCEDGEALPFIALTASMMASVIQQWIKSGVKHSFLITPNGIWRQPS